MSPSGVLPGARDVTGMGPGTLLSTATIIILLLLSKLGDALDRGLFKILGGHWDRWKGLRPISCVTQKK